MLFKELLNAHLTDVALIVGNGINRYGSTGNGNAWEALLNSLAERRLGHALASKLTSNVSNLSLTEYYDMLDLTAASGQSSSSLAVEFCEQMAHWQPGPQHVAVTAWAESSGVPLLTTNFETTLARAGGHSVRRITGAPFSDYYPWSTYFSRASLNAPAAGFGIWHINGVALYPRSIRLGLAHYMGSVEKARGWLYKGRGARLFAGNGDGQWRGATSWLDILFHRALLFIGLELGPAEIFLRWLLIERARYFRRFPARRKSAWYVHAAKDRDAGKFAFLSAMGVAPFEVPDYEAMYGDQTWAFAAVAKVGSK